MKKFAVWGGALLCLVLLLVLLSWTGLSFKYAKIESDQGTESKPRAESPVEAPNSQLEASAPIQEAKQKTARKQINPQHIEVLLRKVEANSNRWNLSAEQLRRFLDLFEDSYTDYLRTEADNAHCEKRGDGTMEIMVSSFSDAGEKIGEKLQGDLRGIVGEETARLMNQDLKMFFDDTFRGYGNNTQRISISTRNGLYFIKHVVMSPSGGFREKRNTVAVENPGDYYFLITK